MPDDRRPPGREPPAGPAPLVPSAAGEFDALAASEILQTIAAFAENCVHRSAPLTEDFVARAVLELGRADAWLRAALEPEGQPDRRRLIETRTLGAPVRAETLVEALRFTAAELVQVIGLLELRERLRNEG